MAKERDITIESALPVVSANGLNTNQPVDFTGSATVALPAGTTIGGSAVVALANITSSATTGAIFSVTATGIYTGVGAVQWIANAATTGVIELIQSSSLTSGTGLSLNLTGLATGIGYKVTGTAATLTTGFYYAANDGSLNVFTVGANGHLTSNQTTAPTIVVTTQNGITAAAVTAGSTDTCGTITTTGTSTGSTVITVTFNKTYTVAPKAVFVQAANAAGGGVNTDPIVTQTATTFVLTIPPSGVYAATPSWTYLVVA